MKRKEIIKKLIKEGFSQKTLLNIPDSQLKLLSSRFINEQSEESTSYVPKEDKDSIKKMKDKKKKFVTYEEEDVDEQDEKEVREWVEQLIQPENSQLTTKNEIMEMINSKLDEQTLSPDAEPDVAEPDVDDPTVEPDEPSPDKDPYHDPWKVPGPGPDPKPKMKISDTDNLPDFLTFDNIVSSVNESKIENLAKKILNEIKKRA